MVFKKALPFKIPKTTSSSLILQKDHEPYFYDKLHQHEEYQLTLIIEGSGTIVHGEYVGKFESGDVFLMGSKVPHVFRCDESYYTQDKQASSVSIFFHHEQLVSLSKTYVEFRILGVFLDQLRLGAQAMSGLRDEVGSRIRQIMEMNDFDRLIHFLSLLHYLSAHKDWRVLLEQSAKQIRERDGKRLDEIFSFTLSNYQRSISIEEIADVANMNASSFCRYFKDHTRKTYIEFINEYRVQKALSLMAKPDYSIAHIAFEVGFNNLSNFNRHFKKVMKVTPRVYRKSLIKTYS
jgi:AraC-like DNA-binding protein